MLSRLTRRGRRGTDHLLGAGGFADVVPVVRSAAAFSAAMASASLELIDRGDARQAADGWHVRAASARRRTSRVAEGATSDRRDLRSRTCRLTATSSRARMRRGVCGAL